MNDKGCSLACTGTFCWIWFWRSIEVFFLAVAAVLLYFFFIIDCITEDSFEIINGNNTIIVIRECANWRQLEAILAISTTIGAAASLALLGVLRHTTRYVACLFISFTNFNLWEDKMCKMPSKNSKRIFRLYGLCFVVASLNPLKNAL
jgi:hypothetical protein